MKPWTIKNVLAWTAKDLAEKGIETARLDAEVLLASVLEVDRLGLYLDLDRPLDENERSQYREMVSRRRRREPVAYLTGVKDFWSSSFAISGGILIPRPDTEVLVEEALEHIPDNGAGIRGVDVGCGSGCIGITLALERKALHLIALDLDPDATAITLDNATTLGVSDRLTVVRGDLLSAVGPPVDIVVSNLPYIPSDEIESLEPEVSRWEPRKALDGGQDGLDCFRSLLRQASSVIVPQGLLILEVGHDKQAQQVIKLFDETWTLERVRKDYSGIDRVVVARRSFVAPNRGL